MLTSTSQSTVPLLVAKILTHLVSEVFAESDVRAEGKQNKCVSVTRSGTLPVCLAILKVYFSFFLQDFCRFSQSQTAAMFRHLQIHHHHIYTFFFSLHSTPLSFGLLRNTRKRAAEHGEGDSQQVNATWSAGCCPAPVSIAIPYIINTQRHKNSMHCTF